MLCAGNLNKRISLMAYDGGAWTFQHGLWAKGTAKERVIYSPYAAAAPGMEFVIRKISITPHEAFRLNGQHYMLTEPIEEIESGAALKINAAAVNITACTRKVIGYTMGALNRPVESEPAYAPFYGILAQKYARLEQQQPNAVSETGFILTTPKGVVLATRDIITIADDPYVVQACYTLAPYRNDYEIVRTEDV